MALEPVELLAVDRQPTLRLLLLLPALLVLWCYRKSQPSPLKEVPSGALRLSLSTFAIGPRRIRKRQRHRRPGQQRQL
jgi:hypothetical protein